MCIHSFMTIIKYRFMPIKFHSYDHEIKYKLALMALILEVVVMAMNSLIFRFCFNGHDFLEWLQRCFMALNLRGVVLMALASLNSCNSVLMSFNSKGA